MRLAFSAALDGVIRWGMHVARGMIMCNSMIAAFLTAGRLWVVKTGECLFKISPASSASLTHLDVAHDMSTIIVADAHAAVYVTNLTSCASMSPPPLLPHDVPASTSLIQRITAMSLHLSGKSATGAHTAATLRILPYSEAAVCCMRFFSNILSQFEAPRG